jgi:hypothetical protein
MPVRLDRIRTKIRRFPPNSGVALRYNHRSKHSSIKMFFSIPQLCDAHGFLCYICT